VAAEGLALTAERQAADFDSFFSQHFGKVYGLLYRVTGSAEEAEDLSQELFLRLSQRQPPPWESEMTSGWLWMAATHMALNALRSARRRAAREERAHLRELPVRRVSEREEDPASRLIRNERRQAARAALRRLKPQDSMLLLARHSGLSYAEVAAALDLNPASVGTLLARAEQRFKQAYFSQEQMNAPDD
jgi:RNA polymerase sigma factor (sigma-70 family)